MERIEIVIVWDNFVYGVSSEEFEEIDEHATKKAIEDNLNLYLQEQDIDCIINWSKVVGQGSRWTWAFDSTRELDESVIEVAVDEALECIWNKQEFWRYKKQNV